RDHVVRAARNRVERSARRRQSTRLTQLFTTGSSPWIKGTFKNRSSRSPPMRYSLVALLLSCALGCNDNKRDRPIDAAPPPTDAVAGAVPDPVKDFASMMIDDGRKTFRFDTFGDEAFWGTSLQLQRAVAG